MDSVRRSFVAWKMGVYALTHLASGDRYIGSSRNIARRWQVHESHLCARDHVNPHLQRAWDKYGSAAFAFSVLDYIWDEADLRSAEQQWIVSSSPPYNIRRALRPRADGPVRGSHKLTQAAVGELRRRAAQGESTTHLARLFGVSPSAVRRAVVGDYWRHVRAVAPVRLPRPNQKLTEREVRDIRARFAQGEAGPRLARAYDVSHALVRKVVTGQVWKHVPLSAPTKQGGARNSRFTAEQIAAMRALRADGATVAQIVETFGISRSRCYAILGRRYR